MVLLSKPPEKITYKNYVYYSRSPDPRKIMFFGPQKI